MVDRIFTKEEHAPFTYGGGDTAVLLVHGFPGTPAETRPLAAEIGEMGVTARSILLPGFGTEYKNLDSMSASDWINAVRREITMLRSTHRKVVLLGFSMGGGVSICAASRVVPDALILFAPFWTFGVPFDGILSLVKHVMREVKPLRFANLDDPDIRQFMIEIGVDMDDPESVRHVRNEVGLSLNAVDQLRRVGARAYRDAPRITVPTLIVQGREDTTVTCDRTRRLLVRFGGPVSYQEIPGHHHVIRLQNPSHREEVIRVVQRFLDDQGMLPSSLAQNTDRSTTHS